MKTTKAALKRDLKVARAQLAASKSESVAMQHTVRGERDRGVQITRQWQEGYQRAQILLTNWKAQYADMAQLYRTLQNKFGTLAKAVVMARRHAAAGDGKTAGDILATALMNQLDSITITVKDCPNSNVLSTTPAPPPVNPFRAPVAPRLSF